jgi:GlcNAc-P-P-Und epimerase
MIRARGFFSRIESREQCHPCGRRIQKSFGFVGISGHQLCALLAAAPATDHRETFYLADPPLDVENWARLISAELGRHPLRQVPLVLLHMLAGIDDTAKALG